MTKFLWTSLLIVSGLLLTGSMAHAQLGTTTGTTTLTVPVAAEAALTVATTPNFTQTGTNFTAYSAATNLTYFIRTNASGTITLQVTSDFSPAGGPSVATPPTAGDKLAYTCTVATPGNNGTATACSGSVTAATGSATSVATFGADARSLFAGNSGSVSWTLTNDPKYKVNSYSAVVTFTINAP